MDMSRCWRSMSRIIRKLCSKVRRLCYNHFEDDDVEEALIINKESLRKLSSDHLNSDELRRDAHIWQNRTNELREEVRILKKQVKECVTEKDALYIGLKRAKEEMSELRAALRLQQDVLKERTAEIRAIQDQVRRRDARIGEYVQTIRDLQEQISVMKKQVQECIVYKEAMKKVGNEQREELSGESKSSTEQCPVKESENEGPDGEPQAAAQPGVTIKKLEHQTPSNRPDSSQDTSRKSFADELAPGVTLLQRTNTDYRSFCEAYDLGPMVARGSFGQVFAATRKSDKLPVAVKFIKRARGNGHMQHPDDPEAVPMEVATMRAVCAPPSCPWIIQLLDWYCGSSKTLLVLERPKQCMSLSEFARNNRWRLSEKQASLIFQQIVRAIQHCHARGVSHNSLNLDNILIEMPTEQVKVINFSYALFLEPEEGTRSAGFYAPLGCFLQDRRQTVPLTVKTLGVLLYEMLCGALTFGRELEIMHNIFTCERKLSIECKELIQWCLKPFPNERPSLEEIIIHPFVSFCHLYQKLS